MAVTFFNWIKTTLSNIAGADVADADEFVLIDQDGDGASPPGPASKAITRTELRKALGAVLHVRDEKADGTGGGSASATTWNVRTLNTVKTNEISGASLGSNQITLPAGTYEVRASAPAWQVNQHRLRLRDVTNSITLLAGQNAYANNVNVVLTAALLGPGRFTLAGTAALELQHWTNSALASEGLGVKSSDTDEVEVYAEVWIKKIS